MFTISNKISRYTVARKELMYIVISKMSYGTATGQ